MSLIPVLMHTQKFILNGKKKLKKQVNIFWDRKFFLNNFLYISLLQKREGILSPGKETFYTKYNGKIEEI